MVGAIYPFITLLGGEPLSRHFGFQAACVVWITLSTALRCE